MSVQRCSVRESIKLSKQIQHKGVPRNELHVAWLFRNKGKGDLRQSWRTAGAADMGGLAIA
jgi:hypothetical protein